MRRVLVAGAVGLLATVVLALAGWPASGYRDADFIGFWIGARLMLDGKDPYDFATVANMHAAVSSAGRELVPGLGFGYPLPTALLVAPFALVPVAIAAPLWLVAQGAAAIAGLLALARSLGRENFRRDAPVVVALAVASQPAWVLAASGNVGGFLLGIVATAIALVLRGRPIACGAVLGLLVLKPHPFLLFVPIVLLVLGRRDALRAAAGGLAVAGAVTLVSLIVRPSWPAEWLATSVRLQETNVSRANAWGLAPADARWLGWIAALAAVLAFAWWWRARRPASVLLVAAGLALSLFVAPYVWSYDHLVLAATAAVGVAALARYGGRVRAIGLVALACAVVVLPWILYAAAFARGNEAPSAVVPLVLAALLIAFDALEREATRRRAVASARPRGSS